MPEKFDFIVIGAGPGGYVAAIRAAQLGMRTACVENTYLGGTCLNVGCIPSKALLDSTHKLYDAQKHFARHGIKLGEISVDLSTMQGRKEQVVKTLTSGVGGLFRKHNITHLIGTGRITARDTVQVTREGKSESYNAARILIATGSAPTQLPGLPFDGVNVLSSTEALSLKEIPKRMIVVGAGYIGVELGSVWARLGSKVLVLEFLERALPNMDKEMAGLLQRSLEKQGIEFRFKTSAKSVKTEGGKIKLTWASGEQGGAAQGGVEECDKVLVAVGRVPVTANLGVKEMGIELDARGFIKVDKEYATNIPGIYAIGDVIGGLMLAHKAEDEGIVAVERMNGIAGHVNYHAVPAVVYTHPELAQVGYTEEEAVKAGHEIKVGKFPFAANGRARAMDETEGIVKMIADAKTDRVLGIHILGAHASDMIAEAAIAVELAASSEDIARAPHAHPTLPEAVKEAAMAVEKRQIHV